MIINVRRMYPSKDDTNRNKKKGRKETGREGRERGREGGVENRGREQLQRERREKE